MKTRGTRTQRAPYTYYNWSIKTGVRKSVINVNWFGDAHFESTDGEKLSGFTRMRKSGELLPFTTFSQIEEDWAPGLTSWSLDVKNTDTHTEASTVLVPEDLSLRVVHSPPADQESLYTRLMAKMGTPDWDALTFAAELRKVIAMFRDFLPKLRAFILQYDKREVVDMYLSIRYGLRPLVYDMMNINAAILRLGGTPRNFIRKRVEDVTANVRTIVVPWGNITYELECSSVMSTRMAGVSSVIPPAIGVNPVVTVWELTRLSFVLDWVVDVGSFLQGLTSLAAYGNTLCGLGMFETMQVSIKRAYITPSSLPTVTGSVNMHGSYIATRTTRIPYDGRSMTVPLQFDLDFWKVVDLAAIAASLMRVGRRNPPPPRQFYYRSKRPVSLPDIVYK